MSAPTCLFSKVLRACPKFLTRDIRPNDPWMSVGYLRCCFPPPSGRNRQGQFQSVLVNFSRLLTHFQSILVSFQSISVNFSQF